MAGAGSSPIYDIYATRWVIFGSVFIAIFFAFLYIKFMDLCALQCAWLSVFVVGLGFIGSGTWCWILRNQGLEKGTFAADSSTSDYLFWGAIILWVVSALYVCCLVCNQKALRVSIRIIEVAGDFVADTKRVMFVPVGFFFVAIITSFAWLYGYICITSIGTITIENQLSQEKDVAYGATVSNMLWIMIFGYFWIMAFILACNEFVIIVSAATWYFSDKTVEDDDGIAGDAEVYKGFTWIFRYHFGSLAMGSLLVAIVWMIRFVFEYVAKKMEAATGANAFTKCVVGCIRCCLDCFDRLMRYLTRNAYIYMAISSEGFCSSALNSFILMLKNAAKFAFVQSFSEVFMFIAKICISVFSVVASLLIMMWSLPPNSLANPAMPALFILLIAYVIAGIFVSVFDAASNTLLQCYLVDDDIRKQGKGKLDTKHIPAQLTKFLVAHEDDTKGLKEPLMEGAHAMN